MRKVFAADVASLERRPVPPRVAVTIQDLLARNASPVLVERIAGGAAELRRILETYFKPPGAPRYATRRAKLSAFSLPPPSDPPEGGGTRERQRWERRTELGRQQAANDWRIECVERIVCGVYSVSAECLAGPRRDQLAREARAAFCFLVTDFVTCGVTRIALHIGRDHATVHHYGKMRASWMRNAGFVERFNEARTQIEAAFAERVASL